MAVTRLVTTCSIDHGRFTGRGPRVLLPCPVDKVRAHTHTHTRRQVSKCAAPPPAPWQCHGPASNSDRTERLDTDRQARPSGLAA